MIGILSHFSWGYAGGADGYSASVLPNAQRNTRPGRRLKQQPHEGPNAFQLGHVRGSGRWQFKGYVYLIETANFNLRTFCASREHYMYMVATACAHAFVECKPAIYLCNRRAYHKHEILPTQKISRYTVILAANRDRKGGRREVYADDGGMEVRPK